MAYKKISTIFTIIFLGLLSGCSNLTGMINPKGEIASKQLDIMILSTVLMLIVVIPVVVMALAFAWKYRASNTKATYAPDWGHSGKIEAVVWIVPIIIVAVLGFYAWETSHSLDPKVPIVSNEKTITIQAVSLDWKWLFIYPEYGIATVNTIAIPVDAPVKFLITSDAPMNSFWIPELGGQIYSMAAMQTTLYLISNQIGETSGRGSNYTGNGYNAMTFNVKTMNKTDFNSWVASAKTSTNVLDNASYLELVKPSQKVPPTIYVNKSPKLFQNIMDRHNSPGGGVLGPVQQGSISIVNLYSNFNNK